MTVQTNDVSKQHQSTRTKKYVYYIFIWKKVNNNFKDLLWVNAVFIGQNSCQMSNLEGNIFIMDPTKQLYPLRIFEILIHVLIIVFYQTM